MTLVGKILVFVIMIFSVLFMGMSVVVFTTSVNWKEEVAKQKKQVTDLNSQLATVRQEAATAKSELDAAKADHAAKVSNLQTEIAKVGEQNKQAIAEVTATRKSVETAQENVKAAQAEARDRLAETTQLRELLKQVQKQANEFKLQQTELNDTIAQQRRELESAQANNVDLRGRVAGLTRRLRELGQSTEVAPGGATARVVPDVEGVITRVNPTGTAVELSIGADDGLAADSASGINEMDVYRLNPPAYIGRVRVESVDPDQATARVIGKTRNGLKIKEGDIVSSKIRPRG